MRTPDSQSGVQWIPPMGFDSLTGTLGTLPVTQDSLVDSTRVSALPNSVSVLQIVTTGLYMWHVEMKKGEVSPSLQPAFGGLTLPPHRGKAPDPKNPGERVARKHQGATDGPGGVRVAV
jgi:hypothetical protein